MYSVLVGCRLVVQCRPTSLCVDTAALLPVTSSATSHDDISRAVQWPVVRHHNTYVTPTCRACRHNVTDDVTDDATNRHVRLGPHGDLMRIYEEISHFSKLLIHRIVSIILLAAVNSQAKMSAQCRHNIRPSA